MKQIKKYIYIFILIILSASAIQKEFSIINIKPLKGAIIKKKLPKFNSKSFFNGKFQNEFNNYVENNIGFRPPLIRINNQIDYSLFNITHANSVIIGKENYLYEKGYILSYLGRNFIGKKAIDEKLKKLKYLQDKLKEKNIDLIVVFAPGKASFFPEYIPEKFNPSDKKISNYEYYSKRCNDFKINNIDFNKYFMLMKDTSTYPLYSKYGIHWSIYGMTLASDSLIKYIEKKRNIDMPDLSWDRIDVTNKLRGTDYDIGRGLNLLWQMPHKKMAYPHLVFEKNKNKKQPSVIAIADSYYWNIFSSGISKNIFKLGGFWYYNKKIYPDSFKKTKTTDMVNIKAEIEKQDVIILMATEATLKKFAFGFIDRLYSIYTSKKYTDYNVDELLKYETAIRNNKKLMKKVKAKAKKRGISLDEMVYKDALWIYKHKRVNK
ncbi:MAG: hypothetical protein J7J86_08455 [Bacteroidales bacterium]|nr:hypothetical protein [Bacteroidales bacterium]